MLTPEQATNIASNRDIRMGSKLDYLYQVMIMMIVMMIIILYFQTQPRHGVFSRLHRLALRPLQHNGHEE